MHFIVTIFLCVFSNKVSAINKTLLPAATNAGDKPFAIKKPIRICNMSVPFFCTSPVGAPVDMFEAGKAGLPVFAVVSVIIPLNMEAFVCESVDEP